jgi:hypothetical protein
MTFKTVSELGSIEALSISKKLLLIVMVFGMLTNSDTANCSPFCAARERQEGGPGAAGRLCPRSVDAT